jgi:hypothetical protein
MRSAEPGLQFRFSNNDQIGFPESAVPAIMTTGMPPAKLQLNRWRERMEILISGRAPSDPFYLTNRTWLHKLKMASLIAAPVLLLTALVTVGATDRFRLHQVVPDDRPPAEAPAKAAQQKPLLDPILASTDLEVVNMRIARDTHPPLVSGLVRNTTDRKVDSAEVSYYLADAAGNLVGTDKTEVANVAPHGSVAFRLPLKIAKAQYVFVRDAHPN